jgi:prevent-host-death family protein
MIDLNNIVSLTDFQRNAKQHIERLRDTGKPQILTVNGRAEIVIQDAASYQRLLDQAEAGRNKTMSIVAGAASQVHAESRAGDGVPIVMPAGREATPSERERVKESNQRTAEQPQTGASIAAAMQALRKNFSAKGFASRNAVRRVDGDEGAEE